MKFSPKVILFFRAEFFLLFVMIGSNIRSVTFTQLTQDKICKFIHNQTDEYCQSLPDMEDNNSEDDIKSQVLVRSSRFNMYYQALAFLPSIFAAIILGSWCDKYKPGRKILMWSSAFGITIETIIQAYSAYNFKLDYWYAMIGAIPSALGLGISTSFIAVYSYIPSTSPPDISTVRFMFAEAMVWLANPLATFLGGLLLNYNTKKPIGGSGQLLNYEAVYIASAAINVLAFFWAIFLIDEERDKRKMQEFSNDHETIYSNIQMAQNRRSQFRPLDSIVEKTTNPFKLFFSCDNFKDMIETSTKPRPNRVRLQIWLITLAFALMLMGYVSTIYVGYQFTQKVYLWNSKKYSTYNSLASLFNSFGILFGSTVLIRLFKIRDIPLAIVGISASMLSLIARATFLDMWGFWGATLLGSIGGMGAFGIRAYVSKIIAKDEISKIFSLMASVDGSIPLISSFFFTTIFTATLNTFPGTVYDASAGLLLIPLAILIFIDGFCPKSVKPVDENMNTTNNKFNSMVENNQRSGQQLTYRTTHGKALRHKSNDF